MADIYKATITEQQVLAELRGRDGITTRAQRRLSAQQALASTQALGDDLVGDVSSLTTIPDASAQAAAENDSAVALQPEGEPDEAAYRAHSRPPSATEDREVHTSVTSSRSYAEGRKARAQQYAEYDEDTLDSEGFVVPKRVARARGRAYGRVSPISSVGTVFNAMFYDPEVEGDTDNEDSGSETSESQEPGTPVSTSWDDLVSNPEVDPFGPIPEEWSKDPYENIPVDWDWMRPASTSTPVKTVNDTVFEDLVQLAVDGMDPQTRAFWERRGTALQGITPGDGETSMGTEATDAESKTRSVKQEPLSPVLQFASMHMHGSKGGAESDDGKPRFTASQKGKGRAVAMETAEPETSGPADDDEGQRAAQIKHDEEMAKALYAKQVEDADKTRENVITIRYEGTDGVKYEVDFPADKPLPYLPGLTGKPVPVVPEVKQESSSKMPDLSYEPTPQKPRRESRHTSLKPSVITTPAPPIWTGSRVTGRATNMVVPEHQMPLNSLLSTSSEGTWRW
ncbi:hypothetical protein EXIGLDRAFT_783048 [Exidia glandulosa HHB12029]|uniref:Uncharacterized protein n=1 Tax=Exidia glandulosa HHB12029 TaxID=1314781 RepID=A0A166NA99_EXIGL|nr:hypothetical protein EXIGLDRAFT_783048 [Exidia glandulosa HHB12029]